MRLLLPAILLLVSCSSKPHNELSATKWQLFSMTAAPGGNLNSIDSIMMDAFTEDTSYRVYADFNTDTTLTVTINSSDSKDTSATNYKIAGDTLFLLHTDTEDIDTYLIKSHSKEMLQVNTLNGLVFKFKRIR
jgi:hypothetical protein